MLYDRVNDAIDAKDYRRLREIADQSVSSGVRLPYATNLLRDADCAGDSGAYDILLWWSQNVFEYETRPATLGNALAFCRDRVSPDVYNKYHPSVLSDENISSHAERGELVILTHTGDWDVLWAQERRTETQIDIKMLFLNKRNIGRMYGRHAIRHMINQAPEKVKVWTTDPLDDEDAAMWKKAGFRPIRDDLYVFEK